MLRVGDIVSKKQQRVKYLAKLHDCGKIVGPKCHWSKHLSQKNHTPTVMLIAGSDSGGGAGLQADLRAVHAHGLAGACVVTAATAQNPSAVYSMNALSAAQVSAQISAIFEDIEVSAIKIGMLATAPVARVVFERMRDCRIPLVLDPVLVATSGGSLLTASSMSILRNKLLPLSTVLTPNIPEASALLGRPLGSLRDRRDAARELLALGAQCVLLKGGHADGRTLIDVIADRDGITELRSRRLNMTTHGTGCTYASAIAAQLALGRDAREAIVRAHEYLQRALRKPLRMGRAGVCSPGFVAAVD